MWYMRAMVAIETPAIRVRKHWHNYATHHDKEASTSVNKLINSAIKVYASVYEPHATELGMNGVSDTRWRQYGRFVVLAMDH